MHFKIFKKKPFPSSLISTQHQDLILSSGYCPCVALPDLSVTVWVSSDSFFRFLIPAKNMLGE